MKKHTRKALSLLVMIVSVGLLLNACGRNSSETPSAHTPGTEKSNTPAGTDPVATAPSNTEPAEVKMTDGYFYYLGPKTGDMVAFFRFNEDGTYYGSFFNRGVVEAGTYAVVDKNKEYIADPGPDGEYGTADDEIASASQVVLLTNYATGSVQEVAFNGKMLLDFSLGGLSHHNNLEHRPDYDYIPANEEIALAVQVFYYDNDAGASLTLYHNKTFNDFTTVGDFGSWEMVNGVFNLTTLDNEIYTLTVSEDGKTAVYARTGDTLHLTKTTSDALYSFTAVTMPEGLPMDVDVFLNCTADNICELVISHAMMGDIVVDTGTYRIENMVFITFTLEHGGVITGEPDFATATEKGITVSIPYTAGVVVVTPDYEMPLFIDCILIGDITA